MSAARFRVGDRVRYVFDDMPSGRRFATVAEIEPSISLGVFVQFDDDAARYAFAPEELVTVPWWSGIDELPGSG